MLKMVLSLLGVYKIYEKWLRYQVKNGKKPEHVAIILDGNRRWALKRRLNPFVGHRYGAETAKDLLKWCLDLNVKSITLYSFSTENFLRLPQEVNGIMQVVEESLHEILEDKDIHKHKVRVRAIGRLNLLPKSLQGLIRKVEEDTKHYDERTLNLALAYGGRAEIIDATKKIIQKVEMGKLKPEEIDEDVFEKHLYTAHMPKPDPDLVIRTSGERRLSGFLLWQCAYSELCFQDVYWPEFRRIELLRAVRTYQKRKRRYGR